MLVEKSWPNVPRSCVTIYYIIDLYSIYEKALLNSRCNIALDFVMPRGSRLKFNNP